MNRNFLLIALCLCVALPVSAQPDWETVNISTTEDFLGIYHSSFPPWVVGTNAFVASVANDFTTWTHHDIGTSEDLLSVVGPSSSSRYIAGRNGTFRYTTNNGATWQSTDLPDTAQDYVVYRPNSTFFALGSGGAIYADLNGGSISWLERESGTTSALRAAESTSVLMAFGDDGTMLLADNLLGENWTSIASGTSADLYAVAEQGASNWLVVGEGGLILKSTDNGETWEPRASGTTATLYDIVSVSGLHYLVVGEDGTLLETTDLGETWCTHTLPTTATLRGVWGQSGTNPQWFVAGDGGVLLRSQTEGGGKCVPVANEPPASEPGYSLSQPWPNPARARASFSLSLDRTQHITAEVYDLLGRRVSTILDRPLHAGAPHTLRLDTTQLSGATYIVRITGDSFLASRVFTVTK